MNIIFFMLAAGIPLAVALTLITGVWRNGWITIALVLFASASSLFSSFIAPWYAYSYWLLAIVWLVSVASVAIGLYRIRKVSWDLPGITGLALMAVIIVASFYFGMGALSAISATRGPAEITDLEFPLRDGVYAITQGGSGPPLQAGHARTPSQTYALDVVKLNGALYTGGAWLGANSANAEILGETVYSPCNGAIVVARDGLPNTPVIEGDQPAGNLVVVACKGLVIAFGHLETNSLLVSPGETVAVGEPLGKVGMSGRTFGPHLHFHAEKGEWQGDISQNPSAAMSFDKKFLWKNRIVDRRN